MSVQIRCPTKLHCVVTDEGLLEVACRSDRCGWKSGLVVLHYIDPASSEMRDTKIFRAPPSPGNHKER